MADTRPNEFRLNAFGQPVGAALPDWRPRPFPEPAVLEGRFCRLEPIALAHAADLFAAFAAAPDARDWTYLPFEERGSAEDFAASVAKMAQGRDPQMLAIIAQESGKQSGKPVGVAGFMRIEPTHGVIEIGHVHFSPALQRTAAASEAILLMIRHAFETLGFRRLEWKCDTLNARSRAAALRFGFTFEGVFRQALVTKGRNRDTAWYSIIDGEWPMLREAHARWLAAENFDIAGRQKQSLGALVAEARAGA